MRITLPTRTMPSTDDTTVACRHCDARITSTMGHAWTVAVAAGWLPIGDELVCGSCHGNTGRRWL